MPDEKRCMVCGAIIPEGRHICLSCEGQEIPRTVPRIRTNGDKLRSTSLYDLLVMLNERHCVMGALCEHPNQRCTEYDGRCEECIAEWLESEADHA